MADILEKTLQITTGTPTAVTGNSVINAGGAVWYRIENFVAIRADIATTKAINAGDVVLQGIPQLTNGNQYYILAHDVTGNSSVIFNIWNDGTLRASASIANGHSIRFNTMYLM